MWSTPSLPLFSVLLWPGVLVSVRVPSTGQIEKINNLLYLWPFNCVQKMVDIK